MDAWEDSSWRHLVWTDAQLATLTKNHLPWLRSTLEALPASKV
jgi:hypothetical protein